MICFSWVTVSCFPTVVRAGTSGEAPPRPRSPWHWAQANWVKSWAPAATLSLTAVAPPFGTVPTTVTVFVADFVPQAVRAPAERRPQPIAAASRAKARQRAMAASIRASLLLRHAAVWFRLWRTSPARRRPTSPLPKTPTRLCPSRPLISAPLAPDAHARLIRQISTSRRGGGMAEHRRTTPEEAKRVGDEIGVDWSRFDLEQFRAGMDVEFEHGSHDPQTDVTHDDPIVTGKIALAHMKEFPDYYERLERMESQAERDWAKTRQGD